jgi:hypothetical protein
MNVGKPKKIHRVEPVKDPVPHEQPQEPPKERPAEAPSQPRFPLAETSFSGCGR